MRNHRLSIAIGLGLLAMAAALVGVGVLSGQPAAQAAAGPVAPQQVVQASGFITVGTGTCFPDAVLVDCNNQVLRQLRGPNGWAFFAPYANKWTNISGQELTCAGGDKYLNVVTLQVAASPCVPGSGTPVPTALPPAVTPTPTAVPLPGSTVDIQDTGFVPSTITVAVGTRVQWTNKGAIAHTVTHGGGLFDSGNIAPGQMYSFQFTTAGVYVYNDKNNAALTGVVTVQSGAAGGNVAFGRPIRASSSQPGHPPEMAVDGDRTTYWASYAGSPWSGQNRQWIYVDLGSTQDVSSMHMLWGNQRFPRSYALYTWADYCRGWCLLGSTNRGDGDDTWTTNGKVSGQYFLMDLVQPYFNGGEYQLLEWEIFGPGGGTVPPVGATNLALNKAATASSQDIGFEAAKGTDGNLATEYHSAVGLPAWYYVDLGAVQDFDRVDIHWSANMHATSYTLYTWNGRGWGPVYSTRSGAGGDESLRIAPQRSRYALLYAAAGPANMIGIREFEVYYRTSSSGGGVTPPAPPMPSPPAPPIPFGSAASGIWSLRPIAGKPDVVPAGLLTVIDAQVQPSRGLGTSGKPAGDLLGVSPNALPNPANPAGQARD